MARFMEGVLLCVCLLWAVGWTAFLLHCFSLAYRFGRVYWFKARTSRKRTLILCIVGALYTLARPFTLYTLFLTRDRRATQLRRRHFVLYLLSTLLAVGPLTAMALLTSLRIWQQYFDTQLAVQVGITEWRSLIDESYARTISKSSWFLSNRHSWGNQQFLDRIGLALWLTVILLSFIAMFVQIALSPFALFYGCF